MKRFIGFFISYMMIVSSAFSQAEPLPSENVPIFDRVTKKLKEYRPDTTTAPYDKITRIIIELRTLRGGFNINEAIEFKLEEDRQKKEMSESEFKLFTLFFRSGRGKKWLDNSVIWIYRQQFTYPELKKMVKFYKTSAGQKLATEFPVVMMKSLAAAEAIKKIYTEEQTLKNNR